MTSTFPTTVGRSSPGPPPLPASRISTADHRQAACTHTNVTRLFDTYGSHRCQMCRRVPNVGWVYRCTQDTGGFLPESDFNTSSFEQRYINTNPGEPTWELSQWMYESVLKGQYTVEQFSTLLEQRQGVKNAIFAQSERAGTPATSTSSDSTSSDFGNNTTLTSIATSCDDEASKSPKATESPYKTLRRSPVAMFRDIAVDNSVQEAIPEPCYPVCSWTCCQTCRPTYRDRAWLSLDAIVDGPYKEPPPWELHNRRISDARIIATFGLSKHGVAQTNLSPYDSSCSFPISSDSNLAESHHVEISSTTLDGTHNTKTGFRTTVRNALKGAINHPRDVSRDSQGSSKSSIRKPLKRISNSLLFLRRNSSSHSRVGRFIEDGQLQDSLILMIASKTPLPDSSTDTADLHDQEVEVEDGVAVTEEGVGMHMPDIIMHV